LGEKERVRERRREGGWAKEKAKKRGGEEGGGGGSGGMEGGLKRGSGLEGEEGGREWKGEGKDCVARWREIEESWGGSAMFHGKQGKGRAEPGETELSDKSKKKSYEPSYGLISGSRKKRFG